MLPPGDIRIDLFVNTNQLGGMQVGTRSYLVKVTHLPTGLVGYCDTERSQHGNREKALADLEKLVNLDALTRPKDNG